MAETSKSTTKEKAAKTKKETHKEQERLLNRELGDSFPASGPPSLTQPTTEMGGPDRKRHRAKKSWSQNRSRLGLHYGGSGSKMVYPPSGIPLFIGPLDRCPIGVVCITCALVAALICLSACTFFRVRRATDPKDVFDLIYEAALILRVSCIICGSLCESDGRRKHERCRGYCC